MVATKSKRSKTILHKIGIPFLLLLVEVWLVIFIFNFLMFLDGNIKAFPTAIKDNVILISFTVSLILAVGIVLRYNKSEHVLKLLVKWVLLICCSSLVAIFLGRLFGNSTLWYLKYTIGFIVGFFSYLLRLSYLDRFVGVITAIIAFAAVLLCEAVEYLFLLDPAVNPSLFYIKSFSNLYIWVLFFLLIIIPAYIISNWINFKGGIKNRH